MRRVCEVCDESYNDEIHSTICPHQGIGFCRKCDCVVCVCAKPEQPESFDPEKVRRMHAVTVIAVGKPERLEVSNCGCHPDNGYYVHGIDNHYVRAADFDQILARYRKMLEALVKIAGFAPGNGDVCEIIARTARDGMRDE